MIHRQVLATKTLPEPCKEVLNRVMKAVNVVKSKSLATEFYVKIWVHPMKHYCSHRGKVALERKGVEEIFLNLEIDPLSILEQSSPIWDSNSRLGGTLKPGEPVIGSLLFECNESEARSLRIKEMVWQTNLKPGMAAEPTSTVELSLRAEKLADMDLLDKSDPFCVVYVKEFNGQAKWIEVGRTEAIKNNQSPKWSKRIMMEYRFEQRQELKIDVYDEDKKGSSNLGNHDFLGSCQCYLSEVVTGGSFGSVFSKPLVGKKKTSKLFITVEELPNSKEELTFILSAHDLDKKDFFGKGDPFVIISKSSVEAKEFFPIHQTEVIKNDKNPQWKQFTLSSKSICSGDHKRPIKFDVYDWDDDDSKDFIGSTTLTLEEILEKVPFKYDLINPKKKEKKGSKYKNSGVLHFQKVSSELKHSFMDYILSGLQVNFTLAIDFTASNGNPDSPSSLHNRNDPNNPYLTAIRAVGGVVQEPDTPHCRGIDGIIEAYNTSLNSVQLYGPTNFSPVINHVARFAAVHQEPLWKLVTFPCPIIIVGVGNEDFSAMEELDGDKQQLSSGNVTCKRDIVQFVELQKYIKGDKAEWSKEYLAKDVLAEIPNQLVGYMNMKGFAPKAQDI
ncbi:Copine-3,Copine-9,Copine-5,Copine-2,Copine-8 [Lepeophtheirus salmonis]|uniref:Copine-3 n=1 Tax=Lepeophtheirus salmonis TaxID=72036 RepID=A0A7R8CMH0_LEPSM|nr:Copine-3,Copine-9,Copine-5,Copine-2,Copine-8 [Lepeophtheirus salmonis]CAF2832066.1 Copine-3,Copine-9,Copine-5,Copine-2,Copine-8 [Lepeophtheirus salmonis]